MDLTRSRPDRPAPSSRFTGRYEKNQGIDLKEFFESTRGKLIHPEMKAISDAIDIERAERSAKEKKND